MQAQAIMGRDTEAPVGIGAQLADQFHPPLHLAGPRRRIGVSFIYLSFDWKRPEAASWKNGGPLLYRRTFVASAFVKKCKLPAEPRAQDVCAVDLGRQKGPGTMSDNQTISAEYLALQKQLHNNPNYGVASIGYAPLVKQILEISQARSLSDYGAGKQNLRKALHDLGKSNFDYFPYDPAFPEYGAPHPAELVCCIDVLEHIEPDFVRAVLIDLRAITKKIGFFSIATGPAAKILADGRNAHLIQKPSSWWLPKLCEHFEIARLERDQHGFWVIAEPRAN